MQAQKPGAPPPTLRVKVLRAFQDHRREIVKPDTETTLPRLFALEMQAANKCKVIDDPPAQPATAESVPDHQPAAESVSEKPRRKEKQP